MKRHLTEKELIEYQFELTSDSRRRSIAGHLAGCLVCREHLEQLRRKFSSLELLRGGAKVPEELISQVVAKAGTAAGARVVRLSRPAWIGSAAAALLLGLALLSTHLMKQPEPTEQFAKSPASLGTKLRGQVERRGEGEYAWTENGAEMYAVAGTQAVEMAVADLSTDHKADLALDLRDLEQQRFGKPAEESISEQPPFAPASAIELVTLPRRDEVQLTIYNSADLTLVRERRSLTLKKGWNWLQFMWADTLIDPTSLSLEPLEQADKIDIRQLVFPARLQKLGRWLIRSEVGGQVPFELVYFTSGLSWRAFYMGTLAQDEKTMRLDGYVRVNNGSGEDYENAQTRLIVGKVHILDRIAELARRQYPYDRPGGPVVRDKLSTIKAGEEMTQLGVHWYGLDARMPSRAKEVSKEGLSEYFLYTIEGTETIPTGWSKRLLSFDVDEVPVVNLYKYEESRYGNCVVRFLSFKNDEEHELGETPIPGGMLKVYRSAGAQGHLSYTGQSSFKYIPVDEDVELNLGSVADVVVEPKLMEFRTENYRFDRRGNIAGWDEVATFAIEVSNTREIPVKVEIRRNFNTQYWDLRQSGDFDEFEKVDLDTARFTLLLQPRSVRRFEYILRIYEGSRREETATDAE